MNELFPRRLLGFESSPHQTTGTWAAGSCTRRSSTTPSWLSPMRCFFGVWPANGRLEAVFGPPST